MLGSGTLAQTTPAAGDPNQGVGIIRAAAVAAGAAVPLGLSVGAIVAGAVARGQSGSIGSIAASVVAPATGALAGVGIISAGAIAFANSTAPETPSGAVVPPTFPTLPGLGWSVHKKPTFSTRIAKHVSGRQVRAALYAWPIWQFELTIEALSSDYRHSGVGNETLQQLMGFYLLCEGQWGTFLYVDPSDNSVGAQPLGIADGLTKSYLCYRAIGGFTEVCSWVTELKAVYLNGVKLSSTLYTLTAPNQINFVTAPWPGTEITADFSFAFVCHFTDDQEDFEEFMSGLWTVQSLKFESVKP